MKGALKKIQAINGVYFNMIDAPEKKEIGVIVQTVQKVLPEPVKVIDEEKRYLDTTIVLDHNDFNKRNNTKFSKHVTILHGEFSIFQFLSTLCI